MHEAVAHASSDGLFDAALLGEPAELRAGLEWVGADPDAVTRLDVTEPARIGRLADRLLELRGDEGLSEADAYSAVGDPLLQAALMVGLGDVDGSVAGAVRTTGDVVRAGLRGVGAADGITTVSSSFYMVLASSVVHDEVLTFTDAGVVPEPTADQLAEIAVAAARARRLVVGDEPRVAFLSYSTKGSADSPALARVREAVERFRVLMPEVAADGELQGDAALVAEVAARKAPGSPVAGSANVLVFPDLGSANIAYKLVQRLAGAHAVGPILQGLARPFNDLSRGATPADIVDVACITSIMAG